MRFEDCKTLDDVKSIIKPNDHKNAWMVMTVNRIMTDNKDIKDLEELERISDASIQWLKEQEQEMA